MSIEAWDDHAHLVLDSTSPDQTEQHVGGGVVTDRDHLHGDLLDGELGPVGRVLQRPAPTDLDGRGDGDLLGPADPVLAHGVGEGAEHEQLEHRAERSRGSRQDRVHRAATPVGGYLGGQEAHSGSDCLQLLVDLRPRVGHAVRRGSEEEAGDQSGAVDGQLHGVLARPDLDERHERSRLYLRQPEQGRRRSRGTERLESLVQLDWAHLGAEGGIEVGRNLLRAQR